LKSLASELLTDNQSEIFDGINNKGAEGGDNYKLEFGIYTKRDTTLESCKNYKFHLSSSFGFIEDTAAQKCKYTLSSAMLTPEIEN